MFAAILGLSPGKISDSDDNWWVTLISWLSKLPSAPSPASFDSWLIPIALESSQFLSPRITVHIPVNVPAGMDGSCSTTDLSCGVFLKCLVSSFWRYENQDRSLFLRAFRALIPSRERNAVMETIITAAVASTSCQNISHWTSILFFRIRKPETRKMAITIIQMLKHKKMPRKIFCRCLIFTFQSKIMGIKMTMCWGQNSAGQLVNLAY